MKTFAESIEIEAGPETIWRYVGDSQRWKEWMRVIRDVELPDFPETGQGTRRIVSAGGPLRLEEVITHHEPPHLFGYSVRKGAPLKFHQGLVKLDVLGEKQVVVTYTTELATGLPLIGGVFDGAVGLGMGAMIRKSLATLKQVAEADERGLFTPEA